MSVFFSERALLENGAAERAIAALQDRGLIYQGILEPPKGKLPDDWEAARTNPVRLHPLR